MYDYKELKKTYGCRVSQTLDTPIMFAEFWELNDILLALVSILTFGLLFYSWSLLILSLIWNLILGPYIKKKSHRGSLLHWPYRHLGMTLSGLVNPGKNKNYSD